MVDPNTRALIEAAYSKLRENLAAKDVRAEHLRTAALEALNRARTQVEVDPQFVAEELDRLHLESLQQEDDLATP